MSDTGRQADGQAKCENSVANHKLFTVRCMCSFLLLFNCKINCFFTTVFKATAASAASPQKAAIAVCSVV